MTLATETTSRFENMEPCHVWEIFCPDTPEKEYVDFVRNDRSFYGWGVDPDDADLVVLAECIADNANLENYDLDWPHVVEKLQTYMRMVLGHCEKREELLYPKAKRFAEEQRLSSFVTPCDVTRELYGYTAFVFDPKKAALLCLEHGFRGPEVDLILSIFEERADAIRNL